MPAILIQGRRLRILIISRLFIASFLLFYAQFVFPIEGVVFYSIIAVILILSVLYVLWLLSGRRLWLLACTQIAFDLILESALIYYTGGVDSLFSGVYVLSILSAGSVVSPRASFYVATGSAICFIGTVLLVHFHWVPFGGTLSSFTTYGVKRESVYLFYAGYVQVTVFFLVAILTYYFSQKIERLEFKMKIQERLVVLGEVTSNIAHEIRNPLTSISGSVELISKQLNLQLTEKQRKLMDAIVDESLRINRIFNGLLDYARTPELHFEKISLKPFLDEIFLLMKYQEVFNPAVEVKNLYHEKSVKINADPEQMKQVLMNVITNAFEAMPDGGSLAVDVSTNQHEAIISIKDTGAGIDSKTLESIFVPFKTTKSNGTGLGMAQVHKIINQHGGRVSIDTKQGIGTRIDLILPRVE